VKVYLSDDEWLDIGRPEDYAQASETFALNRDRFLPVVEEEYTSLAQST
jgi:NDP-sugar pyrophosphorylase family protein